MRSPEKAQRRDRYRVLVFGDDTRSFLTVVRSLGRRGIEVHAVPFSLGTPALHSRYLAAIHTLPAYDGGDAWIAALLDLIETHGFDLLIPCCDRSILCLDANRHRLKHQKMALPDREAIDALFDKHRTRQVAASLGVKVARGRLLRNEDTANSLLEEFRLPVFIKARRSYALNSLETRGKVMIADTADRLAELLADIPVRHALLVEAGVDGVGKGVSVIADDGEVLCAFQHLRLCEPSGGGGSSLRQSETLDPELLEHCKAIVRDIHYTGMAMFEFRVDPENNNWVLLEVNARFWGSLPLPVALGVDFPCYLFDLYVLGRRCTQISYPSGRTARNLTMSLYDTLSGHSPVRLRSLARLLWRSTKLAHLPLRIATGIEISDTFQADDWKPAVMELLLLPKLASAKLARRLHGLLDWPLSRISGGHKA